MANINAPVVAPEAATYAKLFPEQLADRCAPDALESNSGPIAYLHALYQQALALESTSTSENRFTLADRRPDISELLLDEAGLEAKVAPLTLAINALTRQANTHAGEDQSLTEVISNATHRAGLPFHYPLEHIQAVLKHKKIPLFDLLQQAEYSYPNFCYGNLRTEELRQVMRNATGFSPTLQKLLIDDAAADTNDFLAERFGVTGKNDAVATQLSNVEFFCQKTGLKPEDVQDMLAIEGVDDNAAKGFTSVRRSSAYSPSGKAAVDGSVYGASFINNGKTAVSLEDTLAEAGITLGIKGATAAHFGRMNQIIHLRHALKLSFAETDLLLMSALRAEGQTKDFHITANTLRALGVFRYLNEVHDVTAEHFAALIHEVSPYAVSGKVSLLDRVLDGPGAGTLAQIEDRLIIDNREFELAGTADKEGNSPSNTIIGHLSSALGTNEAFTRRYLAQATQALKQKKPSLSLPLISALYRLSRLPRLLGLNLNEGDDLIALLALDNPQVQSIVAGKGLISGDPDKADTLDVLIALTNARQWLRRNRLTSTALLSLLTEPRQTADILTAIETARANVLSGELPNISDTCLSEERINSVLPNEKLKATSDTWLALLEDYLDKRGLIKPDLPREKELQTTLTTLIKDKLAEAKNEANVAATLATELTNARIQQEDLAKAIVSSAFGEQPVSQAQASDYALPLLKWIRKSTLDLLGDLLIPTPVNKEQREASFALWSHLARYRLAAHLTGLSPAGVEALIEHPQWLDVEDFTMSTASPNSNKALPPVLTVDLLYQLTRYRDWVGVCRDNNFEEKHALDYLKGRSTSRESAAVNAAAEQLATLMGWSVDNTLVATPFVSLKLFPKDSLEAFLSTLASDPWHYYQYCERNSGRRGLGVIIEKFHKNGDTYPQADAIYQAFVNFMKDKPGPLKVQAKDYLPETLPKVWEQINRTIQSKRTITLEKYDLNDVPDDGYAAAVSSISDLDYAIRLQTLCTRTGLSAQSLIDWSWLNEESSYTEFHAIAQLISCALSDESRNIIDPGLQEKWRDGLVDYLLGYWAPADKTRQAELKTVDDLSSYFLTDVSPTWEAMQTTTITQAISSLQHYLFRLFSHLEPGYEATSLPEHANSAWEQYLSQYGTWKFWKAQLNHPENLIYYANRPKKSKAFEELEVEVNQGKLDTELLQTAICNYLTKFERLSNLQIVSGYLDGRDPKNDTYYLVGKTNATPTEYYWRSVDMGLRDGQGRLSPLAWSEWQKIGLTVTGKISQNKYKNDGKLIPGDDNIRLVTISGRLYVFWVEKGVTGLPSTDPTKHTPTPYKKISVHYAFLQSDGFWSTANQLMALDGFKDGQKLAGVADDSNDYFKSDRWVPGLIVFVNTEGERQTDPWLTVILYRSNTEPNDHKPDIDYYIEMRDLLLIKKQSLPADDLPKLYNTAISSYRDIRNIQHAYDGRATVIKESVAIHDDPVYPGNDKFRMDDKENAFSFTAKLSADKKKLQLERRFNHINTQLGVNKPFISSQSATDEITLYLAVKTGNSESFSTLEKTTYTADKNMRISLTSNTITYALPNKDDTYTFRVYIRYNDKWNINSSQYTYNISTASTDELWNILIAASNEEVQYLDLTSVKDDSPKLASNKTRLNTLFGKQLVARASQGVERALDWGAQKIQEPTIDDANPNPTVDFHGANGLYFRELFLHLPALIATRLTEQQQFEDAENWYLRYLFDPYRATSEDDGRPAYWNTRPLAEVGSGKSELSKPVDPTARAFILSRFYRQAVFLGLVENWQLQGDHYYRQLTLSSLNHAWLCYQQALKLIGPLPERAAVSRWTPVALSAVKDASFRTPVNQRVLEARATLEHRLYNLRHGLTLDGKALPNLGWGDEDSDPFASAKGGLNILPNTYNSDRAAIPAYRFRELLPAARAAAQQLLDFGRHYMKLMEDEFNTSLSVLLKSQEIKISDFALRLQKEAIATLQAKKRQLEISRLAAEFRKEHWAKLLDIGRSPREEAATALTWTAGVLQYAAIPAEAYAAGVEGILPKIFGMSVGGAEPEELVRMAAKAMSMSSTGMKFAAAQLLAESGYERRATGWTFDMRQAEWDIKLIDQEIAETNIELNAAIIGLEQTQQERANLSEAYVAMTTGFTIIPIYNWLVPRQELIYGKAYDAVLSMCLGLEAAWRYEIGDYTRDAFIKPSAWSDSYKGMLAGESLLVDLLEMENAFLLANELRLTIRKTFSLNDLVTESVPASSAVQSSAPSENGASNQWLKAVEDLSKGQPLLFEFKAAEFDRNYPGHYLRQLRYVTVSFVMEDGVSADGLCAILTQTGSTTLVAPTSEGADYLYNGGDKLPSSIKRNLRVRQAIALSSEVEEDGLGYNPGESVHELMFHDGRYLPFEGTGAISQWELKIPDAEFAKALINEDATKSNITDILINLVYTARSDERLMVDILKKTKDLPASPKRNTNARRKRNSDL